MRRSELENDQRAVVAGLFLADEFLKRGANGVMNFRSSFRVMGAHDRVQPVHAELLFRGIFRLGYAIRVDDNGGAVRNVVDLAGELRIRKQADGRAAAAFEPAGVAIGRRPGTRPR